MAKKIGKTKRTTDNIIDDAIARQNSWMARRRDFAKRFLKKMNIFAKPAPKKEVGKKAVSAQKTEPKSESKTGLAAYWFPILCALLVIFIAIWVAFLHTNSQTVIIAPTVPEPKIQAVEKNFPSFNVVRIEQSGNVVIAGHYAPNQNVSIISNGRVIATERTDKNGDFVYAPTRVWDAGNYTISLLSADTARESINRAFIYISDRGYEHSVSLLMTKNGSTVLQAPKLTDGDLTVSKIDYLDTGRIVVTGNGLPRLRVSLTLDDKYLGFARVSDHHAFGLGVDVAKLEPGQEYTLIVKMHDGDGKNIAHITHTFTMPMPTGDNDTFYTVRNGDCLWIIARNFIGRGTLYTLIAERNNITNPDLIYPKQLLQIPTKVN